MKTQFIGPIRDQLNSNKILLFGLRTRNGTEDQPMPQGSMDFKGIEADATGIDFVGNEFRIPLRTSRNQGVGSRPQGGSLPAPGNQGYQYISEPLRFHYGAFNISGQLIKASESNEGAFERALTAEMDGVTDDLKRKVNIDAYGDATGALTTVTTGTASATQTVGSTVTFQGGELINIYDVTGTTLRNSAPLTVNSYVRASLTLTFNVTVTTTTGDIIVRASSDSTVSSHSDDLNNVTNGLKNIVKATGALHTLNPATAGQTFWASQVTAAAGAVIGENLLRQVKDNVGFESGSDEEGIWITTRGIRNRFANTLTSVKRFNDGQAMTLRGGFKAIMFDDQPMVIDDMCTLGTAYYLNCKALFWSQMSDWEWMEEDGKTLKWQPGKDSYIAYLFKYCQLGTWARNRHGAVTGGADDTK